VPGPRYRWAMSRTAPLASAALLVTFAACGGDGESAPDARSQPTPFDARIVDATRVPDADDVVHRIDGGLRYDITSNLPLVQWTAEPDFDPDNPAPALTMVSSNLVQENVGGSVFHEWFAEVRNDGAETICQPHIDVHFIDAANVSTLLSMGAFVDAAPYQTVGATSTPCLAPGAIGVVSTTRTAESEVALDQIRTGMYRAEGLVRPTAQPHPLAPAVTGSAVERSPGSWTVQGAVTAGAGAIRNVTVDVYPRGPDGYLVDRLTAVNLGAIAAGESWAYETSPHAGAGFAEQRTFVSFSEGGAR
jgi:hypothetical protein